MMSALTAANRVADTSCSVLLRGESGTGKDVIARAIHAASPRSNLPFVPVSCAAIPEPLLESELFGHERGAFTGATSARCGAFEVAHGGTIFLDEIGDMPLSQQAKLLRALESRTVTRVGSAQPRRIDVRVICATHGDLPAMVADGRFRLDLYHRISAYVVTVPPLRARSEDIEGLARQFLEEFNSLHGRKVTGISDRALEDLRGRCWPGNIRQLRNVIESAVITRAEGQIGCSDLPEEDVYGAQTLVTLPVNLRPMLSSLERDCVRRALVIAGGEKAKAARMLGLHRTTLVEMLKRWDRDSREAAE